MKPLASMSCWAPAPRAAAPGSSPGVTRLGGQMVEHGTDRPVVGDGDGVTDLVGAERPEKGDALRRGERQVVAGTAFLAEAGSEVISNRRLAGEQVPERIGVDLAGESE